MRFQALILAGVLVSCSGGEAGGGPQGCADGEADGYRQAYASAYRGQGCELDADETAYTTRYQECFGEGQLAGDADGREDCTVQ